MHGLTLVISTHGNLEHFLGSRSGYERIHMRLLGNVINTLSVKVSDVILEACYSGLELKHHLNGFQNKSPIRFLSEFTSDVGIWGYSGLLTLNKVQYTHDARSVGNAKDDVVGFKNGHVIKSVQNRNDHTVLIYGLCNSGYRTPLQDAELAAHAPNRFIRAESFTTQVNHR